MQIEILLILKKFFSYSEIKDNISLILTLLLLCFYETAEHFKSLPDEEKAILYAVTGGIPSNILLMGEKLSLKENLFNTLLNPLSSLFENWAKNALEDFRELSVYLSILSALADGKERMTDISEYSGEESNICAIYLKSLQKSGIVKKALPYGDASSKKARYYINDSSLSFYAKFINENRSFILQGDKEYVYQEIINNMDTYMENTFKNICTQYLEIEKGMCPVNFKSLGSYWGTSPVDRNEIEIDIMGKENEDKILFGRCYWGNKKCEKEEIQLIIKNSKKFSAINSYYYIFSNRGFTDESIKLAQDYGNISLVALSEMVGSSLYSYQEQKASKRVGKDETYLL